MGFRAFVAKAFSSGLKTVTDVGAKSITGPVKDVSGAVKDVTGIRKDLVETKLAQYKVEEHESLIQKATLDDIKRYDGKTRRLVRKAESETDLIEYALVSALLAVAAAALLPNIIQAVQKVFDTVGKELQR